MSISMLYHVTHMSLNLPFLSYNPNISIYTSIQTPKSIIDALEACNASIDNILSIIRRFKSQYTLRVAPLVFVHGAVLALDAALAILRYEPLGIVTQGDSQCALDSALQEMSDTWPLASQARFGFRNATMKENMTRPVTPLNPSAKPNKAPSSASSTFEPLFDTDQNILNSCHAFSIPEFDPLLPYSWDSSSFGQALPTLVEDSSTPYLYIENLAFETQRSDQNF